MKPISQLYKLTKITSLAFDQLTNFLHTYYVAYDPVLAYLKIHPNLFIHTLQKKFQYSYFSGFSYVYQYPSSSQTNNKQVELASIMLALPYKKYSEEDVNLIVPPELMPIKKILQASQNTFKRKQEQKSLNLFIGCTNVNYRNRGLLSALTKEIQKEGIKAGYTQFSAHCTNPVSAHLLGKLGYRMFHKVQYKTFQYNGTYPFKDISVNNLAFMVKNVN